MGTAKRERQKANRQLRLEELAKEARKQKTKRFTLRVVLLIAAVVALVGGLYLVSGGDDDTTAATTTTLDPLAPTTVDPNLPTTTAPPKPEIVMPEGEVTELKVTTITEGTGTGAATGDAVEVHYLGYTSVDGVEFDNSYDRGAPIPVTLGAGGVIDGWEQGLLGLKVGGRYQIDIPVDLAYGP
ncbi:MAG: FKBP-type peptidyl-prolyl cis-trans isomerase, partial [Actinomycetota bacterium]|nr:FKBP-type peptidyl-prolyl cis-trans isomerase [Actinomycetota bacterium]